GDTPSSQPGATATTRACSRSVTSVRWPTRTTCSLRRSDLLLRAAVRPGRHRGGLYRRGVEPPGGVSVFVRVVPGDPARLRQLPGPPGHLGWTDRRLSQMAHRRARWDSAL